MKSHKLFIFFPFLFILMLVYPATTKGENWVQYGGYPDGSILSYDKDSVANRTRYIKQVWFKMEVFSIGREKLIQRIKDQGFPVEGYDKFSHHVVLFVINCKEKKSKPLSTIDFDIDGKELFRNSSIDQPDWDEIKPNNPMMSGLYDVVCKPGP